MHLRNILAALLLLPMLTPAHAAAPDTSDAAFRRAPLLARGINLSNWFASSSDLSTNLTRKVQGADTAAPIWAEFMNRAIRIPQYSDMKPFTAPDGIETLRIDKATDLPADETCPSNSFTAAFLVGTAPQGTCSHMGTDTQTLGQQIMPDGTPKPYDPNAPPPDPNAPHRNLFQKMFGLGKDKDQQQAPPPQ